MSNDMKSEIVDALRHKIGSVSALRSIFTRERVLSGQKVIDQAKDNYFDNIEAIIAAFRDAAAGKGTPHEIYEATKSLKAQTEGLGFVFLMELSDGFYKYLQGIVDVYAANPKTGFDKEERVVVQKYAEAIVAALDKRERGKGGMVEAGILNSFELLKRKYSKSGS